MRRAISMCAALLASVLLSPPVAAEQAARLIADSLSISGDDLLVATGNVEVFHQGNRLVARKIIYDRTLKRLLIEGPIALDDGKSVTILASQGDLSDDLRDGLMTGAQVIIDRQLQVTAGALQRVDGRYSAMNRVAASSCQTCNGTQPLWEIRAARVVHDTDAKQLYFTDAQFRMGGIPLAYFPRLRLADPTLKRATGFLIPKIEVTSSLGFGIKTPYFITLGPHRDITLTPYAASSGARSVELRYRQAFATGNVTITGAMTKDNLLAGQLRGYVLASGSFTLPRNYTLSLRAETVSDAGYFTGYGLNEKDRFVTSVEVARANRDQVTKARVLGFYSVRTSEDITTQPSQIADFERQQRLDLGEWGDLNLSVHANARERASTSPLDGSDADTAADGRDVRGYGLRGEWQKGVVLPLGILASAKLGLRADNYRVLQDAQFAGDYQRSSASFAAQLRWPWVKAGANGVHTIEPIAQMVLTPARAERLFNDDSALVEFDEGNLFAINRFPGSDRIEAGSRANIGLTYSYADNAGVKAHLALGRVLSSSDAVQFSAASGLRFQRSDWLVAGQLDMNNRFGVTLRSLWSETGDVRKLELRGAATGEGTGVSMGYLFAPADTDEERSATTSEITLYATQKLSQRWSGSLSSRYDAVSSRLATSGVALVYLNECLQADLSLSRSFASSTTVSPNTTFGFSVTLLGFGGQAAGVAEQCRG